MSANIASTKLHEIINNGKNLASKGIEALQAEYGMRKDVMVKPSAIDLNVDNNGIIHPLLDNEQFDLTKHSRGQLLARAGVPVLFADKLIDYNQFELLRHNVKTLLPVTSKDGVLFRNVGKTTKGVLSSTYRRIDSFPVFESFVETALKNGLVPHNGMVTDTRAFLSFLRPEVIEIVPNEFVSIGMELRSSDYGRGAVELNIALLRLMCKNGMMGFDLIRKVHVGGRFDPTEFEDGNIIDVSARTIELDTATVRSAMSDVVNGFNKYSDSITATVRKAAGEEIDLWKGLAMMKKAGLKKATIDMAKEMYESQLPIDQVPEQMGKWRFANVISLLANNTTGDDQKDLQDLAFNVLMPPKLLAA